MSTQKTNSSAYYPYFDYLRAICAIAVMLYHAKLFTWDQSGNLAVQVFFALSGWLIGGILVDTKINHLPRFYFNRAIRIWIPYYTALGIFLTFSILREPITDKWVEIAIYKATFVYNLFGTPQLAEFAQPMPQKGTFNHVWSVNAEEQFYLIAAVIMVVFSRFYGKHVFTWIALSTAAITFNIYPAIVFGVLASVLNKRNPNFNIYLAKHRLTLTLILIALVPTLPNSALYTYTSPIFSIAIVLLLAVPGESSNFGKIAGGMSYPLYLNHWLGIYAINFITPSMRGSASSALISSLISVAFATSLYLFIDKKILDRRENWHSNILNTTTTLAAYVMIGIGICYGTWMIYR